MASYNNASYDEAGDEAAQVGVIVHAANEKTGDRDVHEPVDQLAAQHAHADALAIGGEGEQDADHAEQGARSAP